MDLGSSHTPIATLCILPGAEDAYHTAGNALQLLVLRMRLHHQYQCVQCTCLANSGPQQQQQQQKEEEEEEEKKRKITIYYPTAQLKTPFLSESRSQSRTT